MATMMHYQPNNTRRLRFRKRRETLEASARCLPGANSGAYENAARQWRAMFDAIQDSLCFTDRAGAIVRCNRPMLRLFGLPFEKLLGRSWEQVLRDHSELDETDLELLRDGAGRVEAECRIGREIYRITRDPMGGSEQAVGSVYLLTNVTDRRLLEDELRRNLERLAELDQRKDEFLAMLAHELRNPLAAISGAEQVLRYEVMLSERSRRAQSILGRQVAHLARLMDDLLDVSRVTHGKLSIRKEPADLVPLVLSVIEAHHAQAEAKAICLTASSDLASALVLGDLARLEQIVCNLMTNALRFTGQGGKIEVTIERVIERFNIRVKDSGIGISAETMRKIFDPFFQQAATLDRSNGGLGVGLSIAKRLVELHGGSLEVYSAGAGKGSEFIVSLPALNAKQLSPREGCFEVGERELAAAAPRQ